VIAMSGEADSQIIALLTTRRPHAITAYDSHYSSAPLNSHALPSGSKSR
jgi:hypothetical protein